MADSTRITKTHSIPWVEETYRNLTCRVKALSGIRIGARIEDIPPGQASSEHHYHTAEEEHVFVLNGNGTLFSGDEQIPIETGDHVCFAAGDARAHHIENTSEDNLTFLVYGERNDNDVVFYPRAKTMWVKATGRRVYAYTERDT